MPFCSFDAGYAMFDSTPIENMFLLEYLPVAQEEYLRVYLYARMLCLHPELGDTVADMANALRIDEETVLDAFRYWEREGLARRLTDRPPTFAILAMRAAAKPEEMDLQYYEFRDFNADLQKLFGSNLIHGEINIPQEWIASLNFSKEAALKLVEYGLNRLKFSKTSVRGTLKKLDKIALEWAQRGVRSLDDVERMIAYEDGNYKAAEQVLRRFGLRRRPTRDELTLADKWLNAWNFSVDDVLDACGELTKASSPSFAYLDKVLQSRFTRKDANWEALKNVLAQLGASAKPTPETLKHYQTFLDKGFHPRTVELAAVQQNEKGRHTFEDLVSLLEKWQSLSVFTPDEAESFVAKNRALSREVKIILNRAGSDRRVKLEDNQMLEGWKTRFSEDLIFLAADLSREKGRPMYMIDQLLSKWEQAGVKTAEEAKAFKSKRDAGKPAANPALNYQQREYSENAYGNDLFYDLDGGESK